MPILIVGIVMLGIGYYIGYKITDHRAVKLMLEFEKRIVEKEKIKSELSETESKAQTLKENFNDANRKMGFLESESQNLKEKIEEEERRENAKLTQGKMVEDWLFKKAVRRGFHDKGDTA